MVPAHAPCSADQQRAYQLDDHHEPVVKRPHSFGQFAWCGRSRRCGGPPPARRRRARRDRGVPYCNVRVPPNSGRNRSHAALTFLSPGLQPLSRRFARFGILRRSALRAVDRTSAHLTIRCYGVACLANTTVRVSVPLYGPSNLYCPCRYSSSAVWKYAIASSISARSAGVGESTAASQPSCPPHIRLPRRGVRARRPDYRALARSRCYASWPTVRPSAPATGRRDRRTSSRTRRRAAQGPSGEHPLTTPAR